MSADARLSTFEMLVVWTGATLATCFVCLATGLVIGRASELSPVAIFVFFGGLLFAFFVWSAFQVARWFSAWTRMGRLFASAVVGALGLAGAVAGIYCAFFLVAGVYEREEQGLWPFLPLEHNHQVIALDNKGSVTADYQEDRGREGSGYVVTYTGPDQRGAEVVESGYTGRPVNVSAFSDGPRVVVALPDKDTLFARGPDGHWTAFHFGPGYPLKAEFLRSDWRRVRRGRPVAPDDYSLLTGIGTDHAILLSNSWRRGPKTLSLSVTEDGRLLRLASDASPGP